MTADLIQEHLPTAQEALRSFLETLLDDEAPMEVGAPSEVESAGLQDELEDELVVGTSDVFLVVLDPSWVKLVSESMLGRPIEIQDDGVDDLFREIASQGYGTLRNQLATRDVKLPDFSIEPFLPDTAVPVEETAWRIPFELTYDDATHSGYVLLFRDEEAPVDDEASADEASADEASADEETRSDPEAEAAPDNAAGATGDEDVPDPGSPGESGGVSVASASFSDLGEEKIHGPRAETKNFALLSEVELEVSVELGRRRLPLSEVLQLTSGSVIELEKLVGEPLSLYANGRFVAEGEAVVIDEKFGIRITSLAPRAQRGEALM
jgi:flagellar motor switch protein FliN/FliY